MRWWCLGLFALLLTPACAPRKTTIASGDDDPQDSWSQGVYQYGRKCVSCHGEELGGDEDAPALVGEGSLPESAGDDSEREVALKTGGDLFDYVQANMPPLEAGSLSDGATQVIVHFILKERGLDVPEDADLATLRALPLR